MNQAPVENKSSSNGCLAILFLGLAGGVIYYTWPFCLLFIGVFVLYLLVEKKNNLIFKASKSILVPVLSGLGIVLALLLFLNIFKGFSSASSVVEIERKMLDLRLWTKAWVNISFLHFLITILVLLGITMLIPQLKGVSRFLKLYKNLQRLTIILATITSFTFFAQLPGDKLIKAEHASIVERYKTRLRESQKSVGEYIAAKTLEKAISSLSRKKKRGLIGLLDSIETNHARLRATAGFSRSLFREFYNNPLSRQELKYAINPNMSEASLDLVIEELAKSNYEYLDERPQVIDDLVQDISKRNFEIVNEAEDLGAKVVVDNVREEQVFMEEIPRTLEMREQQMEVLNKREIFARSSKLKAKETIKALEATFVHTVGLEGTEIREVGGTLIRKIYQEYSLRMFDTHVVKKFNLAANIEEFVPSGSILRNAENAFAFNWMFGSFGGSGGSGSIYSRFNNVVTNQQTMASAQMRSAITSLRSYKSGYGSGKSVRKFGG